MAKAKNTTRIFDILIQGDASSALEAFKKTELAAIKTKLQAGGALVAFGAIAGAASVAAVAGLAAIGNQFDAAYDNIRVNTGASGAELDKLKTVFKDVVRDVPADFGSASDAISGINQRLGLTGRPLREVSDSMLELSRITGTDLNANLQASTRLFGDWGISTDQMVPTMDKLFRASQETGIGFDQLSQLMVQFGSPLRALGLDFDTTAALFSKFEAEGVNIQTAMPGLKFALKDFAAAGKDPAKGLQETIDAIQKAKSPLEAMRIGFETFGQRAGPDMAMAIREGKFELDDLKGVISGGSDTIRKAGEDTMDFSEKFQMLKNEAFVALEPVATRVFDAFGTLLDVLQGPWGPTIGIITGAMIALAAGIKLVTLATNMNPWVALAAALIAVGVVVWKFRDQIINAFQTAFRAVTGAVSAALDWLKANWPMILIILTGPIGIAVAIIMSQWDTIRGVIAAGVNFVLGIVTTVWNAVWAVTSAVWGAIWSVLSGIWNAIVLVVRTYITIAFTVVQTYWNLVWVVTTTIWNLVWGAISGIWNFIVTTITTAINIVFATISGVWNLVYSTTVSVWNTVWGFISGIWENIKSTVSGAVTWVSDNVSRGFTAVKDTALGIFNALKGGVVKVWDLISGAVKKPVNAVIGFINTLLGGLNKVLDLIPGLSKINIPKIPELGAGGTISYKRPLKQLAAGGSLDQLGPFAINKPMAIVGEGNPAHPEFVIPTDPKFRGRALGLLGQLSGALGLDNLEGVPMMAFGGILGDFNPFKAGLDAIKSIGGAIGGAVRKVMTGAFDPVAQGVINSIGSLPDVLHIPKFAAGMANAVWDWVKGGDSGLPVAPPPSAGGGGNTRGAAGTVGYAAAAIAQFRQMFPGMSIGGRAPRANRSDHPAGKALDLMTRDAATASRIISTFMGQAGKKYWIWNRQIASAERGWTTRPYSGPNPHTDHVHLSYYRTGGLVTRPGIVHPGEIVATMADQMAAAKSVRGGRVGGRSSAGVTVILEPGAMVVNAAAGMSESDAARLGTVMERSFSDKLTERQIFTDARIG